jgi:hypothetical protein
VHNADVPAPQSDIVNDRGESSESGPIEAAGSKPKREDGRLWRRQFAGRSLSWMAGIIGTVIALVVGGVLTAFFTGAFGSKTSTTTLQATGSTGFAGRPALFTVQDDVNNGAWALKAPTAARLAPHESRPKDAVRWLPEGAKVKVVCARKATAYRVVIYTTPTHWHWWARLKDGSWLAMANFYEVNVDGSQGFPLC